MYRTEEPSAAVNLRYPLRKAAQKIKAEITIEDYLSAHGVEVRHNRAKCIVHGGSNPTSFSVDPDRQLWCCHSCGHGGDLIVLCELVERHADVQTALVSLAQQFNVELPRKPERWHEWQEEKGRRRKMIRNALAASYQRRFFRMFGDHIEDIEDTQEREAEARAFWESIWPLAMSCAERRIQK